MQKLVYFSLITLFSIFIFSCEETPEDDVTPEEDDNIGNDSLTTIGDYLSSESKYSQFLDLLKSDGEITSVIDDENKDITVFALSNETINNALAELGIDSLNLLYVETLQQIVRYHLNATTSLQREDFNADGIISTLQSENISFDENIQISSGGLNNSIQFIGEEIVVENGVIHEIESLMIPPSIFEEMQGSLNTINFPIQFCKNYSHFKDILAKSEEFTGESLTDILQNPELELTLFLPVDDSFDQAAIEDYDNSQYYFLFANHIIESRLIESELNGAFTTKSGIGIMINENGNISSPVEYEPFEAVISKYNAFDFNNGIIHEIEGLFTNSGIKFSSENIYSTISNDPQYSDFTNLVAEIPSLLDILQNTENITAFIPDNQAFDKLRTALGVDNLQQINPDIIAAVLKYHVHTGGEVRRYEMSESTSLTTIQGEEITFNLEGNINTGGTDVNVEFIDLPTKASNGIIHPIGSILIPPSIFESIASVIGTVAQPILFSSEFTFLEDAILKADTYAETAGQPLIMDILSDNQSNLTFFAPVNQVFEAADLTIDALTAEQWYEIIAEHIVTGDVSEQDLSTALSQGNNTITTLTGTNIQISAAEFQGTSTIAVGGAPIAAADNQFQNGYIHAIAGIVSSVNSYTTVLLGGQNNTEPGFYNLIDNIRYTYGPAAENSNAVDLAYYFANANQATLASIDSEDLNIVYDLVGLPIEGIFSTRNSTRFRVTSLAPEEFYGITLNNQLEDLAESENNTNSNATNLQEGSVVAFKLVDSRGGYVGLINVVEISGDAGSSRSITIDIKVQVEGN